MTIDEQLALPVFAVPQLEKERQLTRRLNELTAFHRDRSDAYRRLMNIIRPTEVPATGLADVPWIPVGLFKTHWLASIPAEQVFRVLHSSGTTDDRPSQVVLDRVTAQRQTVALAAIMGAVLGAERLPMMIVDTPSVIADRSGFTARSAGVLGMMNFGRHHRFVLDDQMELATEAVHEFVRKYGGAPFLVFGFTLMVWRYFLQRLAGTGVDLSNAILVHSGGWKKLQDEAVDNAEFKSAFERGTGLSRIYNFYGMVEQVGSVFLEGDDGYLYAPAFADVIIRNPTTWEPARQGEAGVVQVLSVLPESYPGHSILTEDIGIIHGIDDSTCGRAGKRFSIVGRTPRSELRGCSDTHTPAAVRT